MKNRPMIISVELMETLVEAPREGDVRELQKGIIRDMLIVTRDEIKISDISKSKLFSRKS